MDWTFGKVFTQAFQNAMQSEQQRKKDAQNYNLAVDQLNLDKWRTYNDLNMRGMDLNTRNQQFDVTRQDSINKFNTEMQYDAAKTNREYDYRRATEGFVPDQNFADSFQRAYGMPYGGSLGEWTPFKYPELQTKFGQAVWEGIQNDKNRANQKAISDASNATNLKIANMEIEAQNKARQEGYAHDINKINMNLDAQVTGKKMYLPNASKTGLDYDTGQTVKSYAHYKALGAQGYIGVEDWNQFNTSSMFNGTKTNQNYGSGWNRPNSPSVPSVNDPYNISGTK